jgi:phosphoribosylaminoimidazole-succinocarboxamide synthase
VDTKLEFGYAPDGQLLLIDELLTPDSSRFWLAEEYEAKGMAVDMDKQFVRDYLERIGWNKQPPAPHLPPEVIEQTQQRYCEALRRLVPQTRVPCDG